MKNTHDEESLVAIDLCRLRHNSTSIFEISRYGFHKLVINIVNLID